MSKVLVLVLVLMLNNAELNLGTFPWYNGSKDIDNWGLLGL